MDHRPVRQRVGRGRRKSAAWEERGWTRKKKWPPVEKLGKGSCVSLLNFKFWSFKPNCGYFKRKEYVSDFGEANVSSITSKSSNSQHVHWKTLIQFTYYSASDMVNKCIYFIIYLFIYLILFKNDVAPVAIFIQNFKCVIVFCEQFLCWTFMDCACSS